MDLRNKARELKERGFCVLRDHLPAELIDDCREAFLRVLAEYVRINGEQPNRGPYRHFLAMPFHPPCFAPAFFFDTDILAIVRCAMDEKVVADQWGCDVPLLGSENQEIHADYRRPLFPEFPEMVLPPYILIVSFGLIQITHDHGPIEIAPGTHRLPAKEALSAVQHGDIQMQPLPLAIGDVLIRHPWALHRGTRNTTHQPRPLVTIRYVRRWYADSSRAVNPIPLSVWRSLRPEEQAIMRFPLGH